MQTLYKIIVNKEEIKNCGNLSWGDDIETIASEFSFESTSNIEIGSKILIANGVTGKEVLRGILTDKQRNKNKSYSYSGFDYGFYLNKNEVIIQFNKVKIDTAIRQLCTKVNVPCGNICSINAYVTKIFKDKAVSDIIIELLELATQKTGAKYVFSCQNGKLDIVNTKQKCESQIELAQGHLIGINDSLGNITYSESIQDLKNSITLVDTKEKKTFVVASAKDNASIQKFGLLGQIESIDKDDKTSKSVVAQNMLKDLNKVTVSILVDMLGTDDFKKGSILSLDYPDYGLSGDYYAKSTKHNIANRNHYVNAELGKV